MGWDGMGWDVPRARPTPMVSHRYVIGSVRQTAPIA